MQPAAAWPCLSAAWGRDAASSLFPATVQVHAAAARLHLLLQPPSLLLLSLLLLALTTGSSGWFPGALDTTGARNRGLFWGIRGLAVQSFRMEATAYALAVARRLL